MKLAAFNATCPFEIGDKIKSRRRVKPGEAETFRLDPAAVVEEVHTITDIVCVHSVKNGTVTFLHELDNSGKLVHIAATPRPEQREAATQSGGVMLIAGDESGPLPAGIRGLHQATGLSNAAPDRTESKRQHDNHKNFLPAVPMR